MKFLEDLNLEKTLPRAAVSWSLVAKKSSKQTIVDSRRFNNCRMVYIIYNPHLTIVLRDTSQPDNITPWSRTTHHHHSKGKMGVMSNFCKKYCSKIFENCY